MKVKSVSEIITNSSSETFAKIYGDDPEKLRELGEEIEKISDFTGPCGDGGLRLHKSKEDDGDYWDEEDEDKDFLEIDVDYCASESGLVGFAKIGLEEWLKKFGEGKFQIKFGEEYED